LRVLLILLYSEYSFLILSQMFDWILIITGAILTILILLQPKEAGLGAALTGQDTVSVERR